MPKVSPGQVNFSSGEITPLFSGRVDNERYKAGLDTMLGFIPTIQGGATRMPGTKYVAGVKTNSKATRLIPFEFSTEQAYIIEFGDQYIRFYRNNGQIQSGGSPYEISSPYLEADLFEIHYTQSANVLYLVHEDYAPRILTRSGHTDWSLTELTFSDGPYLPVQYSNTNGDMVLGDTKLAPSNTTGSVNISVTTTFNVSNAVDNGSGEIRITLASIADSTIVTGTQVYISGVTGTTEANGTWTITKISDTQIDLDGSTFSNAYVSGGAVHEGIFRSTDVGRVIRLVHSGSVGWAVVTSFTDVRRVVATVKSDFSTTSSTSDWYLGSYSGGTGYPSTVTFFEDRLALAGCPETPQRLDLSVSSEYTNFATTATDSSVSSSNAISATLNANDVNVIQWLASDEKGLLIGTTGGEWVVRANATYEALTPTNINAKKATSFGSSPIQPIQVGKATLYTQRAKRKLREFTYFYEVDGFKSNDLTLLSENISGTGFVEFAYQKEPYPTVWGVRDDGVLAAMIYERDIDGVRAGWARRIVGGISDASGSDAKVESVAVIPSSDSSTYEVWLVVQRYINGSTVRYIEYMEDYFDSRTDQEDAFFVDSGLTYDSPVSISSITKANPGVVTTSTNHSFSNGDKVVFRKIKGMTELNGETVLVANVTSTTFEITTLGGTNIDTSAYSTYVSTGEVRKLVSTVSGLDHLEGESVTLLVDGAVQANKTVSSGSITLSDPGATIHIGYSFNSDIKTLRTEAGSADGVALGKIRRNNQLGLLLYRTLGLKYGSSFDNLDEFTFRTTADLMTRAPALFTGIKSFRVEFDYDYDNQICLRQSQPLPMTILAILPQLLTQDRG